MNKISPIKYQNYKEEIEKLTEIITQAEQDKALYLNQIKELEEKVESEVKLKDKIQEDKENILLKLKDAEKDIETLKQTSKFTYEMQEELLKNENEKKNLQNEIIKLKQQIEENFENNNIEIKEYTDKIAMKQVIILLIIIISKE